ncbi:MAG: DUF1385 domain-containing protein [Firmicutes bacterium]|nr:DUF1385 domain-containing protein [Bacillota bacterium]
MMKGPDNIAIAVRKPDGEIEIKKDKYKSVTKKNKLLNLPLIRGSIALFEAMILGTKSLMYSAEFYEEENKEPDKLERFLKRVFKDKADDVAIYISVFISIIFAVFLFMLGPSFITNVLKNHIKTPFLLNIVEGIIRLSIFLIYILVVSKINDIKRVFMYHGAEHKSIHCYENNEELTVENAKKYTTLHPRCGTSFLFMVMIVSILVFSLFGWPNLLLRVVSRIVLLPLIAGISYEINKKIGKSNSRLSYILSYPGLMLQRITTNEPDDLQLEVAIASLKEVIPEDKEKDKW